MWPLSLLIPSPEETATLYRRFPGVFASSDFPTRWSYEERCHRDLYREPAVLLCWLCVLWILVLALGGWCLHRREELTGKYANPLRLGLLALVPVAGLVGFGAPMVMAGWNAVVRLIGLVRRSEEGVRGKVIGTLRDGLFLACGPLSAMPVTSGGVEEGDNDDGENADEVSVVARCKDPDSKLPTSRLEILERTTLLVDVCNTPAGLSIQQKAILGLLVTVLFYLSAATVLLVQRRWIIEANAVVDDILWLFALLGLAVCLQVVAIISMDTFHLLSAQHKKQREESSPDEKSAYEGPESSGRRQKSAYPQILAIRLGGLVKGMNSNDIRISKVESWTERAGCVGPYDIWVSIIALQHIALTSTQNGGNPQLATLSKAVTYATLLGVFVDVVAAVMFCYFAIQRLSPYGRVTNALETVPPKVEIAVLWIKKQYSKLPVVLRWAVDRGYLPLVVGVMYVWLYVIGATEIIKLDARKYPRADPSTCVDLWKDPLAEKLMKPLYVIGQVIGE
jgi:hypothetical protein